MKRIISFLVLTAVLLSAYPCVMAAEGGKVEIAFCVGDDTLSINGTDVKVEKPYVVGEGVTLVPLRVITEAFGAVVGWEGTTKTITLTYPDVEIILGIGNPVAEVNKKAQTLLAAPELTPNGVTMVPLRFISETFGAVVGYDAQTARITVTKGASEAGSLVQGGIESKKVGDSYYGWSIDNPELMTMSDRNFDGSYTEFTFNEDDGFCITVEDKDETFVFDREFKSIKDSLANLSLIQADKDTSNEAKKTMHFKAKNSEQYYEILFVEGEKYTYQFFVATKPDSTDNIKYIETILDSFDLTFDKNEAHDLSNVVSGNMREFKSEKMKVSFTVPADYYQGGSDTIENEMVFYKKDKEDLTSYIKLGIFSKSEIGSAAEFAKKDYTNNSEKFNKDIVTINEVLGQTKYKNFDSYEYTFDIKGQSNISRTRDVFFEVGDYVYNMAICIKEPPTNTTAVMDYILNSVVIEPLDKNEIGILIRNDNDYEGTFTFKGDGYSLTVPNSYNDGEINGTPVLANSMNGTAILMSSSSTALTSSRYGDFQKTVSAIRVEIGKKHNVTLVGKIEYHSIGKMTCGEFVYKEKGDSSTNYVRFIVGVHGGKLYTIAASTNELYYSEAVKKEIDDIVKSIVFE